MNPRTLYGSLVALGFIVLVFFIGQAGDWWGASVPAIVTNDSTLLRITNTGSAAWTDLKLTLNGKYTFAPPDPSKPVVVPGHATYYFPYNHFMLGEKSFNPASETPKQVSIEAKIATGQSLKGSMKIQTKTTD